MPTTRALLTAEAVNGLWPIMVTTAKEGADDWRMEDTLDLDETSRVVDALIRAGCDGILW
jgi:trans-o-hydroxybenzylidenepyruvate hydratase-aldolase